jgi:hypothetical protein
MNRLPAKTRKNPSAICARDAFPLDKIKTLGVFSIYDLPPARQLSTDTPSARVAAEPIFPEGLRSIL